MLPLPVDQVHLWLAFDRDVSDGLLADYRRLLLTDEEQARERRFYFDKDRRQFVLTRALVRTVLSRYSGIAPAAWRFATNAYGRPEISNGDADTDALSFNLSHTQGLVMLAISRRQPLGIDVENIASRTPPLDIAHAFFSAQESQALHASPPEQQAARFFHYWTLKESYIKAEGKGLSIPLDQFSMAFPDDAGITIQFHADPEKNTQDWRFCLFQPTPQHVASVCVHRLDQNRPSRLRLVMRQVVPLGAERDFDCPMLFMTPSIQTPGTPP